MKKRNVSYFSIFLLILLFFGLVFADSNGVWNYAKDITEGVFGGDEQPNQKYTFMKDVEFNSEVDSNKEISANMIKTYDSSNVKILLN
jgi:hypothetical protein